MSKKDPYRAVSWLNSSALAFIFVGAIVTANGCFLGAGNAYFWCIWFFGMALILAGMAQTFVASTLSYRILSREIAKSKPPTAP